MRMKRLGIIALLSASALTMAACGKTVEPGNVGVMVKKFGGGVVDTPLDQGWHMTGIGEDIVQYQVRTRIYTYTRQADERGPENEEVVFTDANGQHMSGDVLIKLFVEPNKAPRLYETYKMDLDQLVEGPILSTLQTEIAKSAEKLDITQMLGAGRQTITAEALRAMQRQWGPLGVTIQTIEWKGPIRYPASLTSSIDARSKAEAEVAQAQAQTIAAEASARAKVAVAQGDADAARIRGQALQSNPGLLRQQQIEKWQGLCPLDGGSTCIIGANANSLVHAPAQ